MSAVLFYRPRRSNRIAAAERAIVLNRRLLTVCDYGGRLVASARSTKHGDLRDAAGFGAILPSWITSSCSSAITCVMTSQRPANMQDN